MTSTHFALNWWKMLWKLSKCWN